MAKIPVGVSECLLGEPVRYDGGHKRHAYLTNILSEYLNFQPVCPEVAIGLGIPRQPIRLIVTDSGVRVRGAKDAELDVTEDLASQAQQVAQTMPHLCGYIFMQKSPSCGLHGMKRYRPDGSFRDAQGQGAYAAKLTELMPWLPVEEARSLDDPERRNNFLIRVFTLYDWQQTVAFDPTPERLIAFYSRYKYQVMAHHLASYGAIGRLLADLSQRDLHDICADFLMLLMNALSHVVTRNGNTNTLMHLRGYLRRKLSPQESDEVTRLIDAYHQGDVPLAAPLKVMRQHMTKVADPYLHKQTFWEPYPEHLALYPLSKRHASHIRDHR